MLCEFDRRRGLIDVISVRRWVLFIELCVGRNLIVLVLRGMDWCDDLDE